MIALLGVLRFIMTFNKFDDVYLLTGGAAGTEVVSVRCTSSSPPVPTSARRPHRRSCWPWCSSCSC
ncbi:hypothetical protein NKG94_13920 [Micromonospora sp. M12]